tara:strand:- start:513 stop:773 length:261 start_codon:yes stop_codon:yes gene_type:complete
VLSVLVGTLINITARTIVNNISSNFVASPVPDASAISTALVAGTTPDSVPGSAQGAVPGTAPQGNITDTVVTCAALNTKWSAKPQT